MQSRVYLSISPGLCFLIAGALLVLPVSWILSWLTASALHELAHISALRICGGKVLDIRLGSCGAIISTSPLNNKQEFFSAIVGPACSFVLTLLYRYFPIIAICSLIQLAYNILPVYPLDGGRVVSCILKHFFCEKTVDVSLVWLRRGCLLIILIFCVYLSIVLKFVMPLVVFTVLYLRTASVKIPCK